jgi:hypothetical protein
MLRITVGDEPRVLSFRLEGRLEGPWVDELQKCWRDVVARTGTPVLRVDLTAVTFIDAAGRAQLTAMHREGAEFKADDCLTKAIVSEIAEQAPGSTTAGSESTERSTAGSRATREGRRS